ncbi:NUDIX domain-containing protein [Kitasatospora sp. NPDC004799]|uniref:NUDIX domain-containing protein n=1 Tax=Kitasatospora sp. NPDC004799 TaxID=3154460 RepID=UPI0033B26278
MPDAAARELREEAWLIARTCDLRLVHTIQAKEGWDGRDGFLLFAFATIKFTGELVNVEPDKHLEVRWHPATDALPNPIPPTSKATGGGVPGRRAPRGPVLPAVRSLGPAPPPSVRSPSSARSS